MPEKIMDEIIGNLNHQDWEHRFLAAKRLAGPTGKNEYRARLSKDQAQIRKRLIALLEDASSQVRMQCASALGNLGCREAVDSLMTALADPNEWVRVQVVEAIGKLGNPFIAHALAQHLEVEKETHVRATMVRALGRIGDEKVAPFLAICLEDKDGRVRANSVEALAQLKTGKASLKEAFQKMVNDPSNRVRANVAMSLFSIGDDTGHEILSSMLASKDEFMRASATWACGEIGQAEHRPQIIKLLGDASLMVRKNAIKALVKHGVKVMPDLIGALKSGDPVVRLGALEVLAEFKDPATRQPIIALLEDESGEVRSKAEEILDLIDGN